MRQASEVETYRKVPTVPTHGSRLDPPRGSRFSGSELDSNYNENYFECVLTGSDLKQERLNELDGRFRPVALVRETQD